MFASADGYCSAVVFSDNELGFKYEKPIEAIKEYDVEMMDIPVNNNMPTATQQPQKRRVSYLEVPTPPTITTSTTVINSDQPKKRRITPILISTPMQPPP